MEIEFDPEKAKSNRRKHGVTFAQAEEALSDPLALTIEDEDSHGEQRLVTIGADALGRVLVVIHTQRGDAARVISARKASPGEAEQYHA